MLKINTIKGLLIYVLNCLGGKILISASLIGGKCGVLFLVLFADGHRMTHLFIAVMSDDITAIVLPKLPI